MSTSVTCTSGALCGPAEYDAECLDRRYLRRRLRTCRPLILGSQELSVKPCTEELAVVCLMARHGSAVTMQLGDRVDIGHDRGDEVWLTRNDEERVKDANHRRAEDPDKCLTTDRQEEDVPENDEDAVEEKPPWTQRDRAGMERLPPSRTVACAYHFVCGRHGVNPVLSQLRHKTSTSHLNEH